MSSERLKDSDMGVIGNIMSHITGVTTISIPYNSVGNGGLEILASVVQVSLNPRKTHGSCLNKSNRKLQGRSRGRMMGDAGSKVIPYHLPPSRSTTQIEIIY